MSKNAASNQDDEQVEQGKFQRLIQGKMVVVQCDKRLAAQAEWLLQTIEDVSEETEDKIQDRWTLELGFSVLALIERDGVFIVCEPDFDEDPFESVVEDVSRSLWVVVMQNEVGEITGTSEYFSIPRYDETLVIRKGALGEARIFAQRDEPDNSNGSDLHDSGWYVGGADDDEEGSDNPDDYEACYVYELLETRPMLLSVLALPANHVVVFDGDDIEAVFDEDDENIWNPPDEDGNEE